MDSVEVFEQRRPPFLISTDQRLFNLEKMHQMIAGSYWAKEMPRPLFEKSVKNSMCFGIFDGNEQVGMARVISDYATFAYLSDVFIDPQSRGKGLSKWLVECILSHPELQGLRRFCLLTKDAHGLYRKFGFETPKEPQDYMEIKVPGIYLSNR